MKQLFKIALLTVMLKVWWNASFNREAGEGIFLSAYFNGMTTWYETINTDTKTLVSIPRSTIYKAKWVEVKADKTIKPGHDDGNIKGLLP